MQRNWLLLLLPPAMFLLAAGVTRQVYRVWVGARALTAQQEYEQAARLGMAGRADQALVHLRKAAQQAPPEPQFHVQLAQAFERLGQRGRAVQELERALGLYPPAQLTRESYQPVVSQYAALGRFDEVDRVLKAAVLPRWPSEAWVLHYQGLARFHRERGPAGLNDALALFERSLKANPEYADARYYRGLCLAQLERLPEAEQEYRRLLVARASYPGLHYALAGVLRRQGRQQEAEAVLNRFRALDTARRRVQALRGRQAVGTLKDAEWLELGTLLLRTGQPSEAVLPLIEYIRRFPADPRGHRQLSTAHAASGKRDEARIEATLAEALERRK